MFKIVIIDLPMNIHIYIFNLISIITKLINFLFTTFQEAKSKLNFCIYLKGYLYLF